MNYELGTYDDAGGWYNPLWDLEPDEEDEPES